MIAAADARAAFVLAVDTAMLGVLAAMAPQPGVWTAWAAVLAAIAALCLMLSLLSLTLASFPRTKGPKDSLLYFDSIADKSTDQYRCEVAEMSTTRYVHDLAGQCHRNAEIVQTKFRWLQRSLVALYAGVVPWTVVVYLLYQLRS